MIDLGCCRLRLVLVGLSISPEGQFWLRECFLAVCDPRSQVPYVLASISDNARITKYRQRFYGIVSNFGPAYLVPRERSLGSPLKYVRAIVGET